MVAALLTLAVLGWMMAEGAPAHASLPRAEACVTCHAEDAPARVEARGARPCTPYCLTCHAKAEMDKHHAVGSALPRPPGPDLPLAAGNRTACFTCHELSRPRYDRERWKASSLYDRLFRREDRYPTYFLARRNERGQLCLACH